ncbi:DUF3221 domain-containing protein [Metasolibacillus meyeri]|uniref:DUF3221 domain-containing protein n=1 Tax=Metasolibacillus meyeri TaxID=1071052 RepID=UPI000D316C9E|nr:DUF3221 domain-containing protein [Metasolibacillus meyeri]
MRKKIVIGLLAICILCILLIMSMKQSNLITLEGYVISKQNIDDNRILLSTQLPNQNLHQLDSNDLSKIMEQKGTYWVPLDKNMYEKIALGDQLVIKHTGLLFTSSPPIIAEAKSIKIKK